MSYKIKDLEVWEDFKSGLKPTQNCHKSDIPKRLSVSYAPSLENPYQIDLHGLTIQEAFDKVKIDNFKTKEYWEDGVKQK